jgi:RHS repeat-associated protein
VAELDAAGNLETTYVYGRKPHVPEYFVRGSETYRLVTDPLGSVRLVVRVSDGQVQQRLDYSAFGRVLFDSNPGFQPFGYAGGLWEPQTGLVRFGARDYDPEVGRWTAKDPIGFSGGDTNLYGYVVQDPVNLIDPSGTIVPLLVAAWAAVELGLAIVDIIDAIQTLTDPCASAADKALSAGGLLAGVVAPGGGYGVAGKKAAKVGREALEGGLSRGRAAARSFERTESLSGRASSRKVAEIEESMRQSGYIGDPVKVLEHDGRLYVLDGHHRVEAASRAGVDVQYEAVDVSALPAFGYGSVEEVLRASDNALPNRIR